MTPFLYRIADTFYKTYGNDLQRTAFIFPNRRSSIFFRHYLAQIAGKPIFSPPIYTINNFMQELSGMQLADRTELLFTLYEEYLLLKKNDESFDKFVFWGEMLVNDFDDIDKYLVDARRLFTNIKDLKEIETDYLLPEQIEVISRFWQSFLYPDTESDKKASFASLWQILYDLYSNFRNRLSAQGLAYEGMVFREVASSAREGSLILPDADRFVFIGFNAITTAERTLMQYLRDIGRGDFYWDYYAPTLQDNVNKAAYFLTENRKQFPSRLDIGEQLISTVPQYTVIPVSSGIGQAKQAGKILSDLIATGAVNPAQALNTAIVLPDEEMLIPMLYAIPAAFSSINITMGYPLKNTPASTLFDAISLMQKHIRWSHGTPLFYHSDVLAILNHHFIKEAIPHEAKRIADDMIRYNKAYVSSTDLQQHPFLARIFTPIASAQEAGCYLKEIIDYLLGSDTTSENETENETAETSVAITQIEREYLYHYRLAVARLYDVINAHGTSLDIYTYFALLNKITAHLAIPFNGEPLSGLQIMGVLETRALDFENIIILSMNEGVFPAKKIASSFIPYNLRRGFDMATTEHQDSIYAYYFYRMTCRAKNVFMLYDSRTEGMKKGEMSRYIYQLKYHYSRLLPQLSIVEKNISYNIVAEKPTALSVEKSPGVMKLLSEFLQGGSRRMSASGLNTYLNCPLQFYLQYVEQVQKDDEISETIDSSVFGSIYHGVMRDIYDRLIAGNAETLVTADMLNAILKDHKFIDNLIAKWFSIVFFKTPPREATRPKPLRGQYLIIAHIIEEYVKQTLVIDKGFAPFTYIASELRIDTDTYIPLDDGRKVAFKAFIDRVDAQGDTIRIVDYKTGKDSTQFASVEGLFDRKLDDPHKAICQVALYCELYRKKFPAETRKLKPVIYKIRMLFDPQFPREIIYGKNSLDNYDDIADEYRKHLGEVLTEIFDPEIPFTQTQTEKHCSYCDFKDICKR